MARQRPALPPNDLLRAARLRLPSPSGSGRPMSRQELAEAVNAYLWDRYQQRENLSANDIGKLERGVTRWPGRRRREAFRSVLHAKTDAEIGFFIIRGWTASHASTTSSGHARPGTHAAAPESTHRTFTSDASGPEPIALHYASVGYTLDPQNHLAAVKAFLAADRQVGGAHLYATVIKYLQTHLGPQLFSNVNPQNGKLIFTAAAALTEMAGWMAHDAGRDQAAWRHFSRSLELVTIGGDHQLTAHILASMSHLAHHLGRTTDAIALARRGGDHLAGGPVQPELKAQLLALQARGFAAQRRPKECTKLLHEAEQALALPHAEPPSPWISRFDEGSLAAEAARCLQQLGVLSEARRQAERIVSLRPSGRTRSRAFGQLLLATMLAADEKLEEACTVAREVLAATPQLGSYLVVRQLVELGQLLEPHRDSRVVADFLPELLEALRERRWLYHWLANDTHTGGYEEGS